MSHFAHRALGASAGPTTAACRTKHFELLGVDLDVVSDTQELLP